MVYVNSEERESLGLPLRFGDVRHDGYIFRHYYKNTPDGEVLEQWYSPKTWEKSDLLKKKRRKKHSSKMKRLIQRYKITYGCSICGYKKHPDALHFDHLKPDKKSNDVSKMYSCGKERLKEEIKKCRILCANCHAEHTAIQREKGEI